MAIAGMSGANQGYYTFPLANLTVPKPWLVGTVLFEPADRLRDRISEFVARPGQTKAEAGYARLLTQALETGDQGSSARVPAKRGAEEVAVRSLIACLDVLRLYQRMRTPMVAVDKQMFGLAGEFTDARRTFFYESDGPHGADFPQHGGGRIGSLADWEFTAEDVDQWLAHPGTPFLDHLLSKPPKRHSDVERRLSTALRFLNLSWLDDESAVKVAMAEAALEVLLRRPSDGHGMHETVRRIAYLTCHFECGRFAPWCPALVAPSRSELVAALIERRSGCCTAYESPDTVVATRNSLLHGGRIPTSDEVGHAIRVAERVVMAFSRWAEGRESPSLRMLDGELAAGRKSLNFWQWAHEGRPAPDPFVDDPS